MPDSSFDAIVIGSGISGGWAAKELTEAGLKVLVLERGEPIEHITGYTEALKAPWELPHRGRLSNLSREEHAVMSRDYFIHESNETLWVKDKESPYVEKKPFSWFRGYHVGGRSLMWGRQSYRWSDFDFEANAREGLAVDWPIRYADIAPWYDHVESFAGISGSIEGLPQLPDGKFLPPMELNAVEKHMAARIQEHYAGKRRLFIGRVANLTRDHNGRSHCNYRNKCDTGCPFGAYFSTQSSTLPAAAATGNLTLRPFSIASRLVYDKDTKRATGVEVVDAQTRETTTYRSKIIFLCASTFNSAWILMRSATDVWPGGLGSSSGELGHNVMDHHFRIGAYAEAEGFDDRYYFGRRANGFYIPRFRNLFGDKRSYLRGYGYQGGASRVGWYQDLSKETLGAGLKEKLSGPGPWVVGTTGFGEILPDHRNRIYLDPQKKDKWGMPALAMDCELRENELAMRKDMQADAVEMFQAAGLKNVIPTEAHYLFGQGIHEMGTARMGRDPKTSVLNAHNQVWDAPNVFVTDGSCMASASCVNPSLTYMALTARASAFAVDALKRRDL
jgi:choline dehydrogenase-like flavoprotein